MEGRRSPADRVRQLELACIAGAFVLIASLSLSGLSRPDYRALAIFAGLLVWAENAAVLLPSNARVSPSFMVVMASIAAFGGDGGILGAGLVGSCGGLILDHFRRRKFRIILFNCTQYVWAGAAGALAYQLLQGFWIGIAVIAAALAFAAVNVGLVLPGAASDAGTSMRTVWADMAPALPNYVLFGLLGTLIGALYTWLGPLSVLVLITPLAIARTVFLAFMRLRHAYRKMETLYGFTRRVGGELDVESVVETTLGEVRDAFDAAKAELLIAAENQAVARTVAEGDQVVRMTEPEGPGLLETRVLTECQPVVSDDGRTMVVPIYGDGGGIVGTLSASGRVKDGPPFNLEDLKIFETLANHASVAFANGRLVDRLRFDSLHDSLTGLGNRTLFQEAMEEALSAFAAMEEPLAAVMLLDLDRFKEVNDTLGHESGDRLLREIANRLTSILGGRGTTCRLGGDEFAILLPTLDHIGEAGEIAQTVLTALEQPFNVGDMKLEVGASIGVALAPVDGDTPNTLLQRADVAMYAAKENRTGWELYSREHDRYSPRRLSLAADLRHALERGELALHYQPKAELATGRVTGAEALLRWNHPEYGFVPPDEFIPIAEHTGLIRPLTSWVLNRAMAQVREWQGAGIDLTVAVNLSVRALMDGALPDEVAAALSRESLDATALILEITESAMMADPNRAIEILTRLSDQGVSLAIDDFGTGYSSLAYLKKLPVDEVKVDRSFVMNLATDPDDAVIVRSTVDLARNLGMRVVAEGVEDAASWDHLRVLGCDAVQGYHLARPMPARDFALWLAEYKRQQAARRAISQ